MGPLSCFVKTSAAKSYQRLSEAQYIHWFVFSELVACQVPELGIGGRHVGNEAGWGRAAPARTWFRLSD